MAAAAYTSGPFAGPSTSLNCISATTTTPTPEVEAEAEAEPTTTLATATATETWVEEDWTPEETQPPFSVLNFYDPFFQARLWPQPVDYPFFKRWTQEDWKYYRDLVEQKIKLAHHMEEERNNELDALTNLINDLTVSGNGIKKKKKRRKDKKHPKHYTKAPCLKQVNNSSSDTISTVEAGPVPQAMNTTY